MKYSLKKFIKLRFIGDINNNSWNESSPSNDNNGNESSSNDNNDPWNEGSPSKDNNGNEISSNDNNDNMVYNNNFLSTYEHNWKYNFISLCLFIIFLPFFIRIVLFFILLITNQKDKSIEKRKQLHIFYDYELYLEYIRKYDYKLFKYNDPIFGLMDSHIRSYIRCCRVDLHRHYPNHPRVVNWRKRGYERDFEFCVNEMNDVYQEHNIIYIYNFENVKEYGFKYYNY